jgi:outer membrane protein assembly factor BamD
LLENQGKFYEAYQAYQKVIDIYPFSERINDVIQKEFDIAEIFIKGEERKVLGVLPLENPAIEILNKIIENSPYGPKAALAQYKLGLVLKSLGRYVEAEEAFGKVIRNYPQSEWVESAKYQIATCLASISPKPELSQEVTEEAREKFEEFVKLHPQARLTEEANRKILELKEKEAESNFKIASFYEKQKSYSAAKVYYRYIVENYPKSIWAAKSLERLKILEEKK